MKTFEKLIFVKSKLDSIIRTLESEIDGKVEFRFGIEYQPSDGWCLLNQDNADLSPLKICLLIIEEKGYLTLDDFNNNGI
jgi:hypothetical protein